MLNLKTLSMAGKKDATSGQRTRVIEAARELGADEDEATFKAKLAAIARQKVKGDSEPSADSTGKTEGG